MTEVGFVCSLYTGLEMAILLCGREESKHFNLQEHHRALYRNLLFAGKAGSWPALLCIWNSSYACAACTRPFKTTLQSSPLAKTWLSIYACNAKISTSKLRIINILAQSTDGHLIQRIECTTEMHGMRSLMSPFVDFGLHRIQSLAV